MSDEKESPPLLVRDADDSDMPAIQRIYGFYVSHGLATFEEVPPTQDDLRCRKQAILAAGLPYVVGTLHGQIAGYACATLYRPRSAYRYTVEDSVYVAEGLHSKGIGRALLARVIERCEADHWRQMVAIIGDSGNVGSIALHRRLGFEPVGTLQAVGFKLGRWVDTVVMQRALGQGDRTPPHPALTR